MGLQGVQGVVISRVKNNEVSNRSFEVESSFQAFEAYTIHYKLRYRVMGKQIEIDAILT